LSDRIVTPTRCQEITHNLFIDGKIT